ncbi:MAG TPA: hypothetical protein VGH28_02080 [Polyangiaceae bacterium]
MKARRYLAAAILGAYAVLHGVGAAVYVFGPMRFCAAFFVVGCAVGAVALVRRTFWARRYAMGVALAGLFNCAAYFGWFHDFGGWRFGALELGAFVALFGLLLGKKMRGFYDDLAPHWEFDHPTMHLLAAALSLNVAGIAMLVYYACLESNWTTDGLRISALVTAALLAVGSISAARGRIAGLLLMTAAGGASLWLGFRAYELVSAPAFLAPHCGQWALFQSWGQWETFKSVVGFAPAALGSLLCFGVFLGPMVRFVRNR